MFRVIRYEFIHDNKKKIIDIQEFKDETKAIDLLIEWTNLFTKNKITMEYTG